MTKLINATEFLWKMSELYKKAGWSPKEVHFSLLDLMENVNNEPKYVVTATNANWIPVSERLPENEPGTEYLVTTYTTSVKGRAPYYDVSVACFTDNLHELDDYDFPEESDNRPGWYKDDSEAGFYDIETIGDELFTKRVIAWMPMPEPYREGHRENATGICYLEDTVPCPYDLEGVKHSENWTDIYCQIQERLSNCDGKCYKCQLFTTFMDGFKKMMEVKDGR